MDVFALELRYSRQGQDELLYPVLLRSSSELVLVNCGPAGSLPQLQAAAVSHKLSLDYLTGILITQHDPTHVGGLHELKAAYPNAKVCIPEVPAESGQAKALRLQHAEERFTVDSLPAALRGMEGIPAAGHICLYVPQNKTLLAGDALLVRNGELELAHPALHPEQAAAFVARLQQSQIDRLICYRGGIVEEAVGEKLQKLALRYKSATPSPDSQETHEHSSPVCYAHRKDFREGF